MLPRFPRLYRLAAFLRRAGRRARTWLRRLLDPQLGAQLRSVIRLLSAAGALGAWAADQDTVAAVIGALQGLLALLVLTPTRPPDPPAG